MKLLSDYIDRPLRLVKKSFFGIEYNFVAGEELLASFKYKVFFGLSGVVKGFEKSNIEFYKEKFFSWEVCIREEGKENPFAKYKREIAMRRGVVDLPQGNKMIIQFGFFNITTEITDEKGNILAAIKRPNVFSRTMNVTIKSKSNMLDENPWIIFFALYLVIKRRQRRK